MKIFREIFYYPKQFRALSKICFCKEFLGSSFFRDTADTKIHKDPKNELTTKLEAKVRICDSAFKFRIKLSVICLLMLCAESFANEISEKKKFIFAASINPIHQILLAITADKNSSLLITNKNFSDHNYQLKKSDLGLLQKADLVFYVDDSLEKNLAKSIKNFTNESNLDEKKSSKFFELSKIEGLKILTQRQKEKSVGQKNTNLKIDPHLWLNPQNAVKIAAFILEKVCAIDLENCKYYQKNYQNFIKEVEITEKILHKNFTNDFANDFSGFVFFHDGYQYFENYFALKPAKIISYGHAENISLQDLRKFDQLAKSNKIKCIFSEISDETNTARNLAQNYNIPFKRLNLLDLEPNFLIKNPNIVSTNKIQKNSQDNYCDSLINLMKALKSCSI